ncbi:MAG TPA: hypothetical protein VFR42_07775 [Candidatus Acidoferrum sp.]|nr:hypothetical protein [Candidatus Acidoferrum sp.]
MITSGTNSILFDQGAVLFISSVPGRCACQRTAFLFVGRNGRTHCLECEAKRLMVAPSECDPTDDGPDAAAAFQKAIV